MPYPPDLVRRSSDNRFDRRIRPRPRRAVLSAGGVVPGIECLEGRITPSTDIWTGAAGNNWNDAGNWQGNSAPQAGDDFFFPDTAVNLTATNNFSAGTIFNSISIQASGYSLSGNAVELTHGMSATSSGTSDDTIGTQLDDGSVSVTGGGQLNLTGILSGVAGITFSGDGTLSLAGSVPNTYTGTTTVEQGTLNVAASGALGSGTVVVDNPATLQIDGTNGNVMLANDITLNSSANELLSVAGSNTLSGNITLQQNGFFDVVSGTLTISGAIDDGGHGYGITKIDSGTLVFANSVANTYTGTTRVSIGELDLDSSATGGAIAGPLVIGVSIFGSTKVKYLSPDQVASTVHVTVANSQATLDLNGQSDKINNLTVTNGLVSLPAGSGLTADALSMTGGKISTGAGARFTLGGDAMINNSAAGSVIDGTGTMSVGTTPIITVNTTTPAVGLDIKVPIAGSGGLTLTGGGTTAFSAASANTYTGTTTVDDGTLKLNGTNTVAAIPGALVVGDGTHAALVQLENFNQIASTSDTTVNAAGTLDFNGYDDTLGSIDVEGGSVTVGGAFVTLGGGLTMTGGSISTQPNGNFRLGGDVTINAASTTATIAGNLDLGAATRTFTVAHGTTPTGIDLDIQAVISNGGLTKAGLGTLELDGGNSYASGTTISAGVLQVSNSTALGTSAATVDGSGSLQLVDGAGNLNVANDLTFNSSNSAALENVSGSNILNGTITLGQSAAIAVDAGTLQLGGDIGDGGNGYALTKSGQGTLQLVGTNTYGGATILNAGTLQVDGSIALSSGVHAGSGSTLHGTGTLPDVTADSGATIAPGTGSSTGILSAGDLSMAAGSTFHVALNGTTAGSGYGQLVADCTVDLDSGSTGGATLDVSLGFTPSVSDSFEIIANNSGSAVHNTFNNLPEGAPITVGVQTFQISYVGGPSHNSVVLTATTAPNVAVTAAPNPSQFGQSVTFSVMASGGYGTPTGTATFYDGNPASGGLVIGTPQPLDGSGDASVSTSSLAVGTHQIYVQYSGGGLYAPVTSTLPGDQIVSADPTTTSLSSDRSSTVYGTPVTFTALVSQSLGGTPTGLVNFYDGASLIGSANLNSIGIATISPTSLSVSGSPHAITATYVGSTTSQGSMSSTYSQTITPASLTISADNAQKTYGQTVTFNGNEFTTSGLVNGDSVSSVSLSSPGAPATAIVAGSPYAIDAAGALGSGLSNYTITYVPGQLTVNAAPLTITANSSSKTYGQTATFNGNEFTTSGLVNGDSVSSVSLSSPGAAATATVGGSPYAINAGAAVGSGLSNYAITYVSGQLTVNAAPLTITGNNTSKTYGQTVTFNGTEFTTSGLVNSDSVSSVSLSSTGAAATATVAGSPYAISASNAAGSGLSNYTVSYVPGQLTVNAAPLTITANSTSKTYGQTVTFDPDEFTASGLLNGDSVTAVTLTSPGAGATATVAGSPYAINASDAVGSGLSNYAITYAPGHLAVNAAPLTITANSTSKTYGQTVTFTGTEFATSGLVNGDSVSSVSLSSPGAAAVAGVAGSPYAINASGATGSGLTNYSITYAPGQLTVTPAPLTITANNASRAYGAPNPVFTASYSGFVNGDTPASLTTPATFSTTATPTSPIGQYPIVDSGAMSANYAITFQNGSLSVTPSASVTVLVTPSVTSVVGQPVSFIALVTANGSILPGGNVQFFVDGNAAATVPIDPSTGLATFTTASLGAGDHAFLAHFVGNTNVAPSDSSIGVLTVSPASTLPIAGARFAPRRMVNVGAGVTVIAPGGGSPTGSITLFSGPRAIATAMLVNGSATVSIPQRVTRNGPLTVHYNGSSSYYPSTSPPITISRAATKATAHVRAAALEHHHGHNH